MNQLHPRQDGGARRHLFRDHQQDLIRKARHLATRHRPNACEALIPAAAHLYRRQLEKMVSWTGRERLR